MGQTVLVVDDDEITREGFAAVLRKAGYSVLLAADATEALALLDRTPPPPDLVLLDMLMPGRDGWHFFARRGQDPALAAVPVVITTALGVASSEWAASLGARDFLQKPITAEALLDKVRQCLPPPPG